MTPFEEGQLAYTQRKMRVPPQAPAGNPVGGPWANYAREWLNGWDRANLDAPWE